MNDSQDSSSVPWEKNSSIIDLRISDPVPLYFTAKHAGE